MASNKTKERSRKLATNLMDSDVAVAIRSLYSLIPQGETLTDEEQEQAVDREQAKKNLQKSQGKK